MADEELGACLQEYQASDEACMDGNLVRKIAGLYEQKGEISAALEWYQWALSLANDTDTALRQKIVGLETRQLDRSIKEFEDWLGCFGTNAEAEQVRQQLDDLRRRKAELPLVSAASSLETGVHGGVAGGQFDGLLA